MRHTFTKQATAAAILFLIALTLSAQEALKSTEEEYYDFLSLTGVTERPTLGYRTLSDSTWHFNTTERFEPNADGTFSLVRTSGENSVANVWKNNNLGKRRTLWHSTNQSSNWFTRGIDQGITLKIYGPEWYNSYNTAAPYGQNDGALWQGKGYNTSLTGGARLEAYGFELTLKPQLSFSQNVGFETLTSTHESEYGYFWGNIDRPQRFGNKPFLTFDLGETEARWSWYSLTFGFGTQSPWVGAAWLNPMMHSNNSVPYPKFDIGLRKTRIILPWIDFYIGDIEARAWAGYLTESDYFDNDATNDHNMINGFTFFYAPAFLPGFTIGLTKVSLSKWTSESLKYLNPFYSSSIAANNGGEDQKVSISLDWLSESGGMEMFGEIGIDDAINVPRNTIESYITHIFHTMIYTVGLKKEFHFPNLTDNIRYEVLVEFNNTEMSQDMQFQWQYSWGFHHDVTQGYTNRGQSLGSGIGYGGNSQYFGLKTYYPKGTSTLFIQRFNPDNNFLFKNAIYGIASGDKTEGNLHDMNWNYFRGELVIGIISDFYATPSLRINGGFIYDLIVNPLYNQAYPNYYEKWHNFHISLGAKYSF